MSQRPRTPMERVRAKFDDAKQRTRHVDRVAARCRLRERIQDEAGLPEPGDQGITECPGIGRDLMLQREELPGRVSQHHAQGDLAGVAGLQHAHRVPDLEVKVHAALQCILARKMHPIEVAIQPVHRCVRDAQPGSSVHPRPPSTPLRDLGLRACQLSGQLSQSGNVEWGSVVQAEIDIGVRGVLAAGPAASQASRR